jgi:hypothetical protein
MAPFFQRLSSKTYHMPNQANKSNGKSGIVQPKRRATKPDTQKANQEQTENKSSNSGNRQSRIADRHSTQGSEPASGS